MTRPVEFDPAEHPRRLNIGCGYDRREEYLNVDLREFHEPDLVADARDLAMLPSGGYDEVLAQDVLEHLARPDVPVALAEWARVLRPGGRLVLRVPDLVAVLGLLLTNQDRDSQDKWVHHLFGTQAYDGDFHLTGFTELLLRHQLHDAGFHRVSLEQRDHWLLDVVAERAAGEVSLDLGELRFMRLPHGEPARAALLHQLDDQIARADHYADVAAPPLGRRLRPAKRALARVLRLVTGKQTRHNQSVTEALRTLRELERQG